MIFGKFLLAKLPKGCASRQKDTARAAFWQSHAPPPWQPFFHLDGQGLKPSIAMPARGRSFLRLINLVFFETKRIVSGAWLHVPKWDRFLVFVRRLFPACSINRSLISHLRHFREQMVHSNFVSICTAVLERSNIIEALQGISPIFQRNKLFEHLKKAIYDQILHTFWWIFFPTPSSFCDLVPLTCHFSWLVFCNHRNVHFLTFSLLFRLSTGLLGIAVGDRSGSRGSVPLICCM